jgi:hypothetical protein
MQVSAHGLRHELRQHNCRRPEVRRQLRVHLKVKEAKMYMLRIEHPVPNYDGWKKAFDSDPVGREKSGVRRYQILRSVDDPNYVMIDLEFDTARQAEALLAAMRVVWGRVEGTIMTNPQVRIVEAVETKKY